MPKPKTTLELKHEEDSKHRKALTARKKFLATPEGQAFKASCEEQSAIWRREWMRLTAARDEIKKMLPRDPILVCSGGRTFAEVRDIAGNVVKELEAALDERRGLYWTLDTIKPSKVIVGDAWGADRWVKRWCADRSVPFDEVKADWSNGHRGGPIRNQRMIDEFGATAGLILPGGAGTKDCWSRMIKSGIPVYVASLAPERGI